MEIIVAVSVISLVFTLATSFLWLSFQLATRSKQVAVRYAGIANVLEILASELRSISKFDYWELPELSLSSEGKEISFWMLKPVGNFQTSYQKPILRVSYFMAEKDGQPLLYRKVESPFEQLQSQSIPMLKADFEFRAVVYDEEKEKLLELEDYPPEGKEKELPLAIKVKCRSDESEIERFIYLPSGKLPPE